MKNYNFDDLKGKSAVVTGGSGGIGLSFVEALTSVGVNVAVINRNKNTAEDALKKIQLPSNVRAIAVSADVLNAQSLDEAKTKVLREFGKVDFLINCAGGNSPKATTAAEYFSEGAKGNAAGSFFGLDAAELKNIFDLNLLGTILPTMKFSEEMVARKQGVIINISSVSSFHPLTKVVAYSAAKSSINNFTQWLAVHFAKTNVRVNAIAPGFFLTTQNRFLLTDEKTGALSARGKKIIDGTPMGRFGETEELQGALLYLLSDLSKFVTGVVLPVDGGFTAYSGV